MVPANTIRDNSNSPGACSVLIMHRVRCCLLVPVRARGAVHVLGRAGGSDIRLSDFVNRDGIRFDP